VGVTVDVRPAVRHPVRMNVRTNLLLPKELVEEVDHFAGERGRSRYVAEALRARLKRDRLKEAMEQTAGVLSAEEYPEWSTPEKVVEWVRARRAEVTDPGPDGGR
jgi:metal-responsive CopG/Arc/MetJ family transcriptional regulator